MTDLSRPDTAATAATAADTAADTVQSSRVPMYVAEFAADPHAAYVRMRAEFGPLVPVELSPGVPATLVIGYAQARRILNDPLRFPADPRMWQESVSATCPVRPMMEWRPNALRSAGAEHARYRAANVEAVEAVDQHALRDVVETIADATIAGFSAEGHADLLSRYSHPIAFRVLSVLLGCPDEIGLRIAEGMAAMFEGVDAERGNRMIGEGASELTALRRRDPADDITSRLVAHAVGLDDTEMVHQIVTIYGAGIEPLANLISNTLLRLLTDTGFSDDLHTGDSSVREALDNVLYTDPPLAAFCITYPPFPVNVDGVLLPAHQPVIISMAGCNNDPALTDGIEGAAGGNRAHLSWSVGPHACPARPHAYLIAETAVAHLLDALPEIELAVPADELTWRPGPFHRALVSLPVRFPSPR